MNINNIEMNITNLKNNKTVGFFKKRTNQISTAVKNIVKQNPNNISLREIPKGYGVDYVNRRIVKVIKTDGTPTKYITDMSRDRLSGIGFSNKDNKIYNYNTGNFVDKSTIFKKNGRGAMKADWAKNWTVKLGKLQLKGKTKYTKGFGSTYKPNDAMEQKIQTYRTTRPPNNLNDFFTSIREKLNENYSAKDGKRERVFLKFGNQFRTFTRAQINNFTAEQFENAVSNYSDVAGSDKASNEYVNVGLHNLDMKFFQLRTTKPMRVGVSNIVSCKSIYWKTNQIKTEDNLCLEGALRNALGLSTRVKQMRKNIMAQYNNIYESSKIDIAQFDDYEEFYKIRIKVYNDTEHATALSNEANLIRDTNKTYNKLVKLLYKDEHIFLISGRKFSIAQKRKLAKQIKELEKTKIEKPQKLRTEKWVAFDIETVFDVEDGNFLKCYGISWFVWDASTPFHYDERIHTKEPYCYYANGENCMEKFLSFLMNQPQDVVYKPIGFNNSRFDNFVLCDYAIGENLLRDLFYVNGSILHAQIGSCASLWDICRFLTMSLEKCCKSFNTNPKKQPDLISHYEIQVYYEKYGWKGLTDLLNNNEKLVLYNKLDVICLIDLTQKLRATFQTLWGLDITRYLTISSMSYAKLKEIWKEKKLTIEAPQSYDDDLFIRSSLTAGRCQSFYGKYDYKMPFAMVDVKSLYPTTMGSYGENDCPYPYGEYRRVAEEEKGLLGIYNVDIVHQRCKWKDHERVKKCFADIKEKYGYDLYKQYAPNVIAKREEDKPLNWDYKFDLPNTVLTSVDIDTIRWATEDEGSVIVRDGIVWDESRYDLFIDYLDPLKKEKTRQDTLKGTPEYNEPLREGTKLGSNSISGKIIERLHSDVSSVFNQKNYVKMERDTEIDEIEVVELGGSFALITGEKSKRAVFETNGTKNKPSYLGVFVYAYSRQLMYKKILGRYVSIYMDTDSALMPLMEYDRMCNNNLTTELIDTGEYGCLEEEVCKLVKCDECKALDIKVYNAKPMKDGKRCENCEFTPADRSIGIAPKNYLVENTKFQKLSKRKMKGVRKNDLWRPLDDWGEYFFNSSNQLSNECEAVENVRDMGQSEIRDMREFKCCEKCISIDDEYEFNYQKCEECKTKEKFMNKCYSTEMFEKLVKKEQNKICVFASNINKIKWTEGDEINWEFIDETDGTPNLNTLVNIFSSYKKEGRKIASVIKIKCNEKQKTAFFNKLEKLMKELKLPQYKGKKNKWNKQNLIEEFNHTHRKFINEFNTKEIKNILKLKQQYMIKII